MKIVTSRWIPLAALLLAAPAFASTAYTFASNSGSNSYKVVFTVDGLGVGGTGNLYVQITNLTGAGTNAADTTLISGVFFTVSGTVGAIGTPTSWYSGNSSSATNAPVVTLNNDGTYTTAYTNLSQANAATERWKNIGTGNNVDLTTLTGGQPNMLIVGGLGTFNNSVTNHNPTIISSATFVFNNISGISDATTFSNVYFNQGTALASGNVNGTNSETAALTGVTAAPEPASLSLIAFGLAGLGFAARRKK